MAKAELGGNFKKAVLAWVDPAADPTKGVEQASLRAQEATVAAVASLQARCPGSRPFLTP